MAKTYDVEALMDQQKLTILKLPVDDWFKGDVLVSSRRYDYVVVQNGKVLGTVKGNNTPLTKKSFPALKTSLFSQKLKGVTVWCVTKILTLGQHVGRRLRFIFEYPALKNCLGNDVRVSWSSMATLKVADYQDWYDKMIQANEVEVYYEESMDKVTQSFLDKAIREAVSKNVKDPNVTYLCVYGIQSEKSKEFYEAVEKIVTQRFRALGYTYVMTLPEYFL